MREKIIVSLQKVVYELRKKMEICSDEEKKYVRALLDYIEHFCENYNSYKNENLYSINHIFNKEIENAIIFLLKSNEIWELFKIFGAIAWEKRLVSGPAAYAFGKNILDLYMVSNRDLPGEVLTYIDFIRVPIIASHLKSQNEIDLSRAESIKKEIQTKIDSASFLLNNLSGDLSRIESMSNNIRYQMNFVGLSAAYQDLLNTKNKELSQYFIAMSVFFLAMLLTPVIIPSLMEFVGYPVYDHVNPASGVVLWSNLTSKLAISLPFFLIFLYMFRIGLRNFQSVRGQIVQLQIRQAVCQFVEAYSEYVGKKSSILKDNGEHLKKFESLIFSGLTPDPDSIPSTFDGFEQLIEAAKAIRGNGRT